MDKADQVCGGGGLGGGFGGNAGGGGEGGFVVEGVEVTAGFLEVVDPFLGLEFPGID